MKGRHLNKPKFSPCSSEIKHSIITAYQPGYLCRYSRYYCMFAFYCIMLFTSYCIVLFTFYCIVLYYCIVLFYLSFCTRVGLLPPGANPIAVKKK
jgi:hypothetical protein